MPQTRVVFDANLDPDHAASLAVLVELEARWENLRTVSWRPPEVRLSAEDLRGKQKAYDAFRAKLAAHNKRYAPPHVPELLLNTPARLGAWCRAMGELYARLAEGAQAHCPVHLLEKAYRWADRVAGKSNQGPTYRPAPIGTVPDAVRALEALAQWCAELDAALPAA